MTRPTATLDAHWPALEAQLTTGGAAAVLMAIAAEPDPITRNQLYRLAIRKLGGNGATTTALDAMIAIGERTLEHARGAATAAAGAPEEQTQWLDETNMSAFNLAANLCDCWGDGASRTRLHFEKGLAFADQALRLREELQKPARGFAMAHWARGKHLLSLKRFREAVVAFAACLTYEEAQSASGAPAASSLVNAQGYLALARWRGGEASAEAELSTALVHLRSLVANRDKETSEDAVVYLEQLEDSVSRN